MIFIIITIIIIIIIILIFIWSDLVIAYALSLSVPALSFPRSLYVLFALVAPHRIPWSHVLCSRATCFTPFPLAGARIYRPMQLDHLLAVSVTSACDYKTYSLQTNMISYSCEGLIRHRPPPTPLSNSPRPPLLRDQFLDLEKGVFS